MKHKLFIGKMATGKTTEMIRLSHEAINNHYRCAIVDDFIEEYPIMNISISEALTIATLDCDYTIFIDEIFRIYNDPTTKKYLVSLIETIKNSKNIKLVACSQVDYQVKKILSPILSDTEIIILERNWWEKSTNENAA
jgi:hypothetical protein